MAAQHDGSRRVGRVSGVSAALTSLIAMPLWAGVTPANAATTLTVCAHGCPYTQVSAAVAAANDGDTVVVGPGTYAGGFAITTSITLTGAGAGRTVISGGDHVITVGTYLAAAEPTVAIRGVTITGGAASDNFAGDTNFAEGGGILVPPGAIVGPVLHPYYYLLGATLTLTDSDVTRNVAEPSTSIQLGPCGVVDCRAAGAGGGGIASWGSVTLERSVIDQNTAGGITSDADGGGIDIEEGPLVIDHSLLTGNKAQPDPAIGRFAEGGAIFLDSSFPDFGSLTVTNSIVSNNTSRVTSMLPPSVASEMGVNAGGIHVGDNTPTTITDTAIVGNTATANDPVGEAGSIDGAMIVGNSPLTMTRTLITGNRSDTTAQTTADIGPEGGILELDGGGTIDQTTITDNTTTVTAANGTSQSNGALALLSPEVPVTVTGTSITRNVSEAFSTTGDVGVLGSGVFNNGIATFHDSQITGNVSRAVGPTGFVQGGGIWNGVYFTGPPVTLTLDGVAVTGNSAVGSPGITLQGGGLYTTLQVTLTHTAIVGNRPDQCYGCSPSPALNSAKVTVQSLLGRHEPALSQPLFMRASR